MTNFATYRLFIIIRGATIPITSTRYYWSHCLQRPPLHELLPSPVLLGIVGMGGPSVLILIVREAALFMSATLLMCVTVR